MNTEDPRWVKVRRFLKQTRSFSVSPLSCPLKVRQRLAAQKLMALPKEAAKLASLNASDTVCRRRTKRKAFERGHGATGLIMCHVISHIFTTRQTKNCACALCCVVCDEENAPDGRGRLWRRPRRRRRTPWPKQLR